MTVKCIGNTGYYLSKETRLKTGDTIHTKYPLKIGDIFIVYGQLLCNDTLHYLIKGTEENLPSWYQAELFEVINALMPLEFYFKYNSHSKIRALWGFQELVFDENYGEALEERESYAIQIFLKKKKRNR